MGERLCAMTIDLRAVARFSVLSVDLCVVRGRGSGA